MGRLFVVGLIGWAFSLGVTGGFLAVVTWVQSRRDQRQNHLGQSRETVRPPLPRRDTDWQRLVDLQNKARAEIDGRTPIYDAVALDQAREVLADDARIWAEIEGAS